MKKFLKKILLTCIIITVVTNMVFAEICKTYYNPKEESGNGGWARQPDNAPWCMLTCTKIVLRDIIKKYCYTEGNENGMPEEITEEDKFGPLDDKVLLSKDIPNGINEQEIIKLLHNDTLLEQAFLDNKASLDTIEEIANRPVAIIDQMETPLNIMFDECITHKALDKIKVSDIKKRLEVFDGLLVAADEGTLSLVWESLNDDTKKLIKQILDVELLNIVKTATNLQWEYHGVDATTHDDVIDYKTAIDNIAEEVHNKRMAILIFRDTTKPNETHACVAVRAEWFNEADRIRKIIIYNPWGNNKPLVANPHSPDTSSIALDPMKPAVNPLVNIRNSSNVTDSIWRLQGYFTFNY